MSSYHFISSESPEAVFTPQINRLLRSVLQNVSRSLVSLDLDLFRGNITACLKRLSVPHLRVFRIASPLDSDLALFLAGHTKLEILQIQGSVSLPAKPRGSRGAHRNMVIPMTSLKSFSGPPESCPIFIPGSQVEEIGLGSPGPSRGPDWEKDFAQAILQSNRQIKGLIFAKFHYRNALFDVIGQSFSTVNRLTFSLTEPDQVKVCTRRTPLLLGVILIAIRSF
jgi:hypothetical protein